MNKKIIFVSILLTVGVLFVVSSLIAPKPRLMTRVPQVNNVHEISFSPQETAEPPVQIPTIIIPTIAIPTIVINPTPGDAGFFGQITPLTILLFISVGAIIIIALVAVSKRS